MNELTCQYESPWPHRLAMALVCATFPLIWVGGLVTTTQAGMAVPDWPNTYGYNLFLYPWQTWLFGPWDLMIEHGHRLLGAFVGVISIALVFSVWRCNCRRSVRWLSAVALGGVIGQGILGGMRVLLDARTLAKIHGCVGPAFFGLCVVLCVVTSRRWQQADAAECHVRAGSLHRLALISAILSYVQLVLGAQVRHIGVAAAPDSFQAAVVFHLGMAAILLVHVAMLVTLVLRHFRSQSALARPALALGILMIGQLVLGAATWVVKFGWPASIGQYQWAAEYTVTADSIFQATIVTAHVATGSLIFGIAILIAMRAIRIFSAHRAPRPAGFRTILGVAA